MGGGAIGLPEGANMNRMLRIAAAIALGVGLVGSGSAAVAADTDGCTDTGDGYVSERVCEVEVTAEATCTGQGRPLLGYTVRPVGTSATTTDITWLNPDGPDVTLEDQPLSGELPWPAAAWALDGVDVRFAVNPETTVTIGRPDAAAGCVVQAGGPVPGAESGLLAATGFTGAGVAGIAGGLLLVGAALVVAGRARRRGQPD